MARRVQVKSLYERIGVPEIKPQAGKATFGYVTPSKPSGKNDAEQLGEALTLMGAKLGGMFSDQLKREKIVGAQQGAAIARKHQFRTLNDMRKMMQSSTEEGFFPHGANGYVKEGYLTEAGRLFARSAQAMNHLTEGAEELAERAVNEGTSSTDFIKALNESFHYKLNDLIQELPNNYYTREAGFMEAIQPQLDAQLAHWTKYFHTAVTKKNQGMLENVLVKGFMTGLTGITRSGRPEDRLGNIENKYQQTLDYWSGITTKGDGRLPISSDTPSEDAWYEYPNFERHPPKDSLAPGTDKNKFVFDAYSAHITEIIGPEDAIDLVGPLEDALSRVRLFRKMKMPVSNTTVDAGIGKLRYDALQRGIEKKLIAAKRGQADRLAQSRENFTDYAANAFEMLGPSVLEAWNKDKTKPPLSKVEDLGGFMHFFFNKLESGEIKDPSRNDEDFLIDEKTGKLLAKEDYPEDDQSSYAPSRAVLEHWEPQAARFAALDSIGSVRTVINSMQANAAKRVEIVQNLLNEGELKIYNDIATTIYKANGGKAIKDAAFRDAFMAQLDKFTALHTGLGSTFDIPKASIVLARMKDMMGDRLVPTPQANIDDIFDHALTLLPQAMGEDGPPMHPLQLAQSFANAGFAGPPVTQAISFLKDSKWFFQLQDFNGKQALGEANMFKMMDQIVGKSTGAGSGDIGASILTSRKNLPIGPEGAFLKLSPYETTFRTQLILILGDRYKELVRQAGKLTNYNEDATRLLLNELVFTRGNTPITFKEKGKEAPTEIRKQSLFSEIYHMFDKPHTSGEFKGFPGNGWDNYIKWVINTNATKNTKTKKGGK